MDLIAARMLAQGLSRPLRTADDVVRRLVGVQAQDDWVAAYALRARLAPGTSLETRDAVVSWFMRGTLHLVAAEDAAWLVDGRVAGVWSRAWRKDRLVLTIQAWDPVPQDALDAEVRALDATIER